MAQNDHSEGVEPAAPSFLPEVPIHIVRDAQPDRVKNIGIALEDLGRDADAGIRIRAASDQLLSSTVGDKVGERVTVNFGADQYAAFIAAVGEA